MTIRTAWCALTTAAIALASLVVLVRLTPLSLAAVPPASLSHAADQAAAEGATPRFPFPQHRVYASGTIRPNQRTQLQQDNDVRAAYGRWKTAYLVRTADAIDGTRRYRVAMAAAGMSGRGVTVSEGQGYGMLIVALMAGHDPAAQTIFDGLWRFARAHPSDNDRRLMGWRVPPDEDGNDSAFDGDCDIAYALLLADRQWGSTGAIDYFADARRVLGGLVGSAIGPESRLPMLGDWVNPNGARYNQYTPRSSDLIVGHFRAFRRATGGMVWKLAAQRSQAVVTSLQENWSPATGLLPDFIVPVSATDHTPRPAPANFLEDPFDGRYYYNAARDPWRLGTDALLNGGAISLGQTRRISVWAEAKTGGVVSRIRAGYTLAGSALSGSDFFSSVFAAPLGVAAMTAPSQQQWLNDIYDAVRLRVEGYYEDTVTLLCLLVMTRNFWDPTRIEATAHTGQAFLASAER